MGDFSRPSIRIGGAVVGAVGVNGLEFDKANDVAIAEAARAAVK